MKGVDKLLRTLFRWDHLLMALALGLPFVVLVPLGLLWLVEHGGILWFLGLILLPGTLLFLLRGVLRKRWRKRTEEGTQETDLLVKPDPEWVEREKQVFAEVSRHIATTTSSLQRWEDLPEQALEVVNRVAAGLDGKNKSALKFTLPEALLLLESTASRYREHLRNNLPFSDQVSLATLYWLWRQRHRANLIWNVAYGSSRVARLALYPAAGVLRELEQIVAGGNSKYVTENMLGVLQAVLLEEVAYAAIELYSGRLRFSDDELLQVKLASAEADEKRRPAANLPLRILFVGQTSAGKSTLINALLADVHAETDATATTSDLTAYQTEWDGVVCNFLDSEGLDNSRRRLDRMLEEMTQTDMIVWVVRANRPAREVDQQLKEHFEAWFEARPRRRRPVVIAVVTAVDQLVSDWSRNQNPPPEPTKTIIAAAVKAIANDLNGLQPIPVSLKLESWNLAVVREALSVALNEARQVQRNRLRVEGASTERRFGRQLRKGARGVTQGVKFLGGRFVNTWSDKNDQ